MLRELRRLPGHCFWTDERSPVDTGHACSEKLQTSVQVTNSCVVLRVHMMALASCTSPRGTTTCGYSLVPSSVPMQTSSHTMN